MITEPELDILINQLEERLAASEELLNEMTVRRDRFQEELGRLVQARELTKTRRKQVVRSGGNAVFTDAKY